MLLKRIAGQLPERLAAYIPILEASNIRTTENLLFTPFSTLLNQFPDVPRPYLESLAMYCLQMTAPQSTTADLDLDLNLAIREGESWQGWGLRGLDELVEWDGVGVLDISGGKRTGKTLLALCAALRKLIQDPHAICHWIDTEGSFNSPRAQAILEGWNCTDTNAVLKRLVVSNCFELEPDLNDTMGLIIEELEGSSRHPENESSTDDQIKMLVIDSITTFFKDDLAHTMPSGYKAMINVMEEVTKATFSHGLTTILINGVITSLPTNELSAFSTTVTRPALGTAFTFSVDISLFLQETGRVFGLLDEEERERARRAPGMRVVVEVLKSRISPSGGWAVYETDGVKMFDVIPPPLEDERTIKMSAGLPVGDERPIHGPLAQTLRP